MKKQFFDAIRRGAKTTTLRYWRRPMVRPGSVHKVRGLGYLHVERAEPVEFAHLSDADAHADGFASLAELRDALHVMYPPEKRKDRRLFLVQFRYKGPLEAFSD